MKKYDRNLKILIFAAGMCFFRSAFAAFLFQRGEQVENYNRIIHSLKKNDILTFSNGKSFQIKRILGHGNTTLILETVQGQALRIPLRKGTFRRYSYTRYIDAFYEGYERIKDSVRVTKVYDYLPGEYLLVEKVDSQFSLLDFLEGHTSVSSDHKKRIIVLLFKWAQTTKDFVTIGDFGEEQLVFNGKEWVLVDISGKGETVEEQKKSKNFTIDKNIFKIANQYILPEDSSQFSTEELNEIYHSLEAAIIEARYQSTNCRQIHN